MILLPAVGDLKVIPERNLNNFRNIMPLPHKKWSAWSASRGKTNTWDRKMFVSLWINVSGMVSLDKKSGLATTP
jgi:hypothetical protein